MAIVVSRGDGRVSVTTCMVPYGTRDDEDANDGDDDDDSGANDDESLPRLRYVDDDDDVWVCNDRTRDGH